MEAAQTIDALEEAGSAIELVAALDQRKELAVIFRARRAELTGE